MAIKTIVWKKNYARMIDQTQLPNALVYLDCHDVETMWHAIQRLSVRGAPAIGVAAGFGVLLGVQDFDSDDRKAFLKQLHKVCDYLATSRPTAVNLFNVLDRMRAVVEVYPEATVAQWKKHLKAEAMRVFEEDRTVCRTMGAHGAKLIKNGMNVLTVCNAGALATADYGTALGVMYAAKENGTSFSVYACETRPLLQGARLTTWELTQERIPTTLICDNMAATLMQQGKIDLIIAGADRIAANGDSANKIGTYMLAVLAQYHKVPFYIAAPYSTFDMTIPDGTHIPIEERKSEEVTNIAGYVTAPKNVKVYNPAFDVTPNHLIKGIITERGIISPVNRRQIRTVFE